MHYGFRYIIFKLNLVNLFYLLVFSKSYNLLTIYFILQIDLLKSKRYLLDLARSLTCYKHEKFHIPESHILKPHEKNEKIEHEGSKVQERMLEKKVKKSVGWDKFKDVFMVSAIFNQGSSDIQVRFYTVFKSIKLYI